MSSSASLERDTQDGVELLSQCFRLPAGRALHPQSAARLGLEATLSATGDGAAELKIRAKCFVYGRGVHLPGFQADDDAFSIEPGRRATNRPAGCCEGRPGDGALTALNLAGRLPIM